MLKPFCDYCYVDRMIRIYPKYEEKTKRNSVRAETLKGRNSLIKQLNDEYFKARKSKAKINKGLDLLPVRIYGSGDFVAAHYDLLNRLKFKFYIISKSLTYNQLSLYINKLISIPNLTKIVLSFDNRNLCNYDNVQQHYKKNKIGFAYTGLPDDFNKLKNKDYKFNVFFNISEKKSELINARIHKESCPVDCKIIPLQKACTVCNKCWGSSVTKKTDWNNSS